MDQPNQQSIHELKAEQYQDNLDNSNSTENTPRIEIDEINAVLDLVEKEGFKYLDKYLKMEIEKIKEHLTIIDKNNLMLFQGMIAGMKTIYKRIAFLKQQRELYKSLDKR